MVRKWLLLNLYRRMNRETHIIDATNVAPGRLATHIATLLRGKHKPEYLPHVDLGDKVIVENVDSMRITGKKFEDKIYYSHSEYPGGLKERTMKTVVAEKGYAEVLRKAVLNMIPNNRLRNGMMKRLVIK